MPIDFGQFIIRKPRVSSINANTTKAPSSEGTLTYKPAFQIYYNGSCTTAELIITHKRIYTLIDLSPAPYTDSFVLEIEGQTLQQVLNSFVGYPNYIITTEPNAVLTSKALFIGFNRTSIKGSINSLTVYYYTEDEYFVNVNTEGDIGSPFASTDVSIPDNTINVPKDRFANGDIVKLSSTGTLPAPLTASISYYVVQAGTTNVKLSLSSGGSVIDLTTTGSGGFIGKTTTSVDWKKNDFSFSNEMSRWFVDAGYILDQTNITVPLNGVTPIADGISIDFYNTLNSADKDLSKIVSYTDFTLASSISEAITSILFPASPVLIPSTFELKINQNVQTEGINYKLRYGNPAVLVAKNPEPYNITGSTNIFKIRYNDNSIQTFILSIGSLNAKDIANLINLTTTDIQAFVSIDTNNLNRLGIQTIKGTAYNRFMIEDGSANPVLGFDNSSGVKGDGIGSIAFLSSFPDEDDTPTSLTNTVRVTGPSSVTDRPFLGINTDDFSLSENNILKKQGVDYLVDTSGLVTFSYAITDENLASAILKLDTELFANDYTVYEDTKLLLLNTDYTINIEQGWINLTTAALPDKVYTVTYKNTALGLIEQEVLLGKKATVISTVKGPYLFGTVNSLEVVVDSDTVQVFVFPEDFEQQTAQVVSIINESATGFTASNSNGFLVLETDIAGLQKIISIKNGNPTLGFTNNQQNSGKGAVGGEISLKIKNPPMAISQLSLPSGGDTIIIKNNDISTRYPAGAVIQIQNDFYTVYQTTLDTTANLISKLSGTFTIIADVNDKFIYTTDGTENTITLTAGSNIPVEVIVSEFNKAVPNSAEVFYWNNSKRIKIKSLTSSSLSSIQVKNGNANRTLGFDNSDLDTGSPDTLIQIDSTFTSSYINPDLYTTAGTVTFLTEAAVKAQVPKNDNKIIFNGYLINHYSKDILIRVNKKYIYKVINSSYNSGLTTVLLGTKLYTPILEDSVIEYTSRPIIQEGAVDLYSQYTPIMTEPFTLKKNNSTLTYDVDYSFNDSGTIELKQGILQGDSFALDYMGRRYIDSSISVKTNYSFFDQIVKGTNIKVSFQAINPDCFYLNVLYNGTLMNELQQEIDKANADLANSSSSGFPTGQITQTSSTETGNDSYIWRVGNIEDKDNLAKTWFQFLDNRLAYFETELNLINGYTVGAEDGRVTETDIEHALDTPPTRLFPSKYPVNYPDISLAGQTYTDTNPIRLPALLAYDKGNQNDIWVSPVVPPVAPMLTAFNSEINDINSEISHLNLLLGRSITTHTLSSSGNFFFTTTETMTLYVETKHSGALQQRLPVTVSFIPIQNPITHAYIAWTAANVALQINSEIDSAFGYTVGTASVLGSSVVLTASSNTLTQCCYIITDAPSVNFLNLGFEAAIRSRSVLWTGGYTYSGYTVPSHPSVHLDIIAENTIRNNTEIAQHNIQIAQLTGEMDEWVAPFNTAFASAHDELVNATNFIDNTTLMSIDSSSFDDLKSESLIPPHVFDSIDSDTTLNNRKAALNTAVTGRLAVIANRQSELTTRISSIETTLTTENLYDLRYSWIVYRVNKSNGLLALKKIEDSQEAAHQKQLANNGNMSDAWGSF